MTATQNLHQIAMVLKNSSRSEGQEDNYIRTYMGYKLFDNFLGLQKISFLKFLLTYLTAFLLTACTLPVFLKYQGFHQMRILPLFYLHSIS